MNIIYPSLYEDLDMQRYAKLASDLLPNSNVITALSDGGGQIVWATKDADILSELLGRCDSASCDQYNVDCCHCVKRSSNNVNIAYFNLGELSGRSLGELVFYDIGGNCDDKEIIEKLSNIVEIVKVELGYLYEVNSMAGELGERYDELSMLRASDVALTEYRESRHILSTYIRSCAEHLKVDYAAVWIRDRKETYPGGIAYDNDSTTILPLLERLSLAGYAIFQDGDDGFGVNNKDESLRHDISLPADKKVLMVPVFDTDEKPCGVLTCVNEFYRKDFTNSDKSTLEAVARKVQKYLISTHDGLTSLLNKNGFEELVWRKVSQFECERHLVLFNIDQFSIINAVYGTEAGDMVLTSVAALLEKAEYDLRYIARIESDLFAAMIELPDIEVEGLVNDICHAIDSMVLDLHGKRVTIKCRAGLVALNSKEAAFVEHLYAAEMALASAKEESDNRIVVYKPGNTALLKRRHQLTQVENIKHALEEDRFVLYCQRIQPLSGDEIHYEILVRMIDESGGLVAPDDFIPVAEKFNLMSRVDRWIIEHAFELLCRKEYRELTSNYKWGINLSGMTIGDADLHEFVSDCLLQYNFQPTNLYFEITETAAIKNFQNCKAFMNHIHSIGVQFALDDFGSGLSSFSYLKKLSIDYLKIDGSLVKDIVSSRLDQTMVAAIADIAKVLNVKTIAEYVENDSILEMLSTLDIDYAQGYGIMKPRPVEAELESLLEASQCKLYSRK